MAIRSSLIVIADTLAEVSQVDVSAPVVYCLETGRIRVKNGTWGDAFAADFQGKCASDDSRLTNARTPTSHASTHLTGGTDVIANAGASAGLMSAADKTKIDGVASGATANATDAQLRDRSTHTGSQAESTITNLVSDLAAKAPLASPSLTTPNIGAATGTSLAATGAISSSGTAGIGYATGAGSTVTQATSKSTGVTLSKPCGEITLSNAALVAGAIVSFTLTNTTIAAKDVLIINHASAGTGGAYTVNAQCAAGSAVINLRNNTAGSLSEAIVIRFVLIKGVTS